MATLEPRLRRRRRLVWGTVLPAIVLLVLAARFLTLPLHMGSAQDAHAAGDGPGVVRAAERLGILEKHGLKVCPHAGGVGLCEYVQHMSMIDYLCIAGTREGRVIEYVDHLHEHFIDPVRIGNAAYMPPRLPGFSIEMKPDSLAEYRFHPA